MSPIIVVATEVHKRCSLAMRNIVHSFVRELSGEIDRTIMYHTTPSSFMSTLTIAREVERIRRISLEEALTKAAAPISFAAAQLSLLFTVLY